MIPTRNARLLRSLTFAFGHAVISPDLIDDAEGKGLDLINTLRERGRNASPKDKGALASAN